MVREHINKKKGFDSEEKKSLRELVNEVIPDGQQYQVVYASHVEKETRRGAKTKTVTKRAWYYAVVFQPNATLWVIPLHYDNGKMSHEDAMIIPKEELHRVTVLDGWVKFYDVDNHLLLPIEVNDSNTKDGIECPVNIQQKEEYDAFVSFIKTFADEVNDAHDIAERDRKYRLGTL